MARNALWAVLLSSITIGSLVAINFALDSTRSEPIKGSIGVTLPDPKIHGNNSSSPIVYMMVPNPSGRGHHAGSSIYYAVIFNNPTDSNLIVKQVEIDATNTFNASGGLYPFQLIKSSEPESAELTASPISQAGDRGNIIVWQGNWTVEARSTLSFYAEVLLWDLHIPFVELDVIGRVDYGNISFHKHKTVFSAGSKPNLWYLENGEIAFDLMVDSSEEKEFTIRLTEATGIHEIQTRAELLISIPAGWSVMKVESNQGKGYWATPVISGDVDKGWRVAIPSTHGLKGEFRDFTFTARAPAVDEDTTFLFMTRLEGLDDWGNPVRTIHEAVIRISPFRSEELGR